MKRETLLSARKLVGDRRYTATVLLQRNVNTDDEKECWNAFLRYDRLVEKLDKRLLPTAAGDAH